ncbi:hypothetical protein [Rhodoferax sp.]|uniref:hypothetical protein n=1 Tax=Rhodoferax sp. TaxID=50421 RepID=UPI0026193015|nr:hypothetical protein [Rhodoferax sp.]MDD5479677.1 hypothetical protein [Rhodoferax sp.]
MDDSLLGFLLRTFVLSACFGAGYIKAHGEVEAECERLGAFYVGDKTFKCELKSQAK